MKMKMICLIVLANSVAMTGLGRAQPANGRDTHLSDKEKLIVAWHLARIDSPGPDGKTVDMPQPVGTLILYARRSHLRAAHVSQVRRHSFQRIYPRRIRGLVRELRRG